MYGLIAFEISEYAFYAGSIALRSFFYETALFQKSRRHRIFAPAVSVTRLSVGKIQSFSCSGHGNIHYSALFLYIVLSAVLMHTGENTFLETYYKAALVFETLYAVHSGKRNTIVDRLVGIGNKRNRLKVFVKSAVLVVLAVFFYGSNIVVDIVESVFVFLVLRVILRREIDEFVDKVNVVHKRHICSRLQFFYNVRKNSNLVFVDCRQVKRIHVENTVHKRYLFFRASLYEFLHSRFAYVTLGHVDNSQNAFAVIRVCDKFEICQKVLDFFSLEKLVAADKLVRKVVQREFFFKRTRNRTRSHEYGKIAVRIPLAVD